MNTFLVRLGSGVIVAALFITALLYSQYTYGIVMMIGAVGGVYEFYTISGPVRRASGHKGRGTVVGLTILVVALSILFYSLPALISVRFSNFVDIAVILPPVLFFFFVKELFSKAENPFQEIGWNVLPFIYIVLPVLLLNWVYFDKGAICALSILFMIWFYDSMCYVCGSLFGRTKLIERISPKKTVEGLAGGMVLTLILVFFYNKTFALLHTHYGVQIPTYTNLNWLLIGFVTLIFATLGDLVESLLKRSLNIKDSGSIMPGHGGFLDRLDAILVAVPFSVLMIWGIDRVNDIMLLKGFLE